MGRKDNRDLFFRPDAGSTGNLLRTIGTTIEDENWDTVPLAIFEREVED